MKPKHTLRRILGMVGIFGSLAALVACKEPPSGPPVVPYGQALDVSQAGTFVEFDFRIDKPDRYDVVLEVFEQVPKEKGPLPELTNAHFKVHLQSLAPTGWVLVDTQVSKAEGGMNRISSVGPSIAKHSNLMSFKGYLIEGHTLADGSYRVRVDNLNPIPALQGRLVKVSVERIYHPK